MGVVTTGTYIGMHNAYITHTVHYTQYGTVTVNTVNYFLSLNESHFINDTALYFSYNYIQSYMFILNLKNYSIIMSKSNLIDSFFIRCD